MRQCPRTHREGRGPRAVWTGNKPLIPGGPGDGRGAPGSLWSGVEAFSICPSYVSLACGGSRSSPAPAALQMTQDKLSCVSGCWFDYICCFQTYAVPTCLGVGVLRCPFCRFTLRLHDSYTVKPRASGACAA